MAKDLTTDDIIKYIRTRRILKISYKQIANTLGVKEETVKKWNKGKFGIARQTLKKFESRRKIILETSSFEEEIKKLEKYRQLKKKRMYEGEYITKDRYSVLKVVVNDSYEDKTDLYNAIEKTIKENESVWEEREDVEYFIGCHSYCFHTNLGTQERDLTSELNEYVYNAFKDFKKKFNKYVMGGYVEQWVVTEYWVAGRHNGLIEIDE